MPSITEPAGYRAIPDPCRVPGVLMLALTKRAANEARAGAEAPGPALRALFHYVAHNEPSSMRPLHPELVESVAGRWQLAVPNPDLTDFPLARIQVFTPAPGDETDEWETFLRADRDYIEYVHQPAVRYSLGGQPHTVAYDPDDPQWALALCGFPDVWAEMDNPHSLEELAIVDKGDDKGHEEITSAFSLKVPDRVGTPSQPNHAAAVAGVIGAVRKPKPDRLMGCCSARLRLYNAWPDGPFDPCAYYRALWDIAQKGVPVVNLSLGWTCTDWTECLHIQTCLDLGVVVVAAMGNAGEDGPPFYPAAYRRVVAVGGMNGSDMPVLSSSRGTHMWISAPGEDVRTITGDRRYTSENGTSFAAAFVSAAVWLARQYRPCLTVDDVRDVLKESVAPATIPPNSRKHSPDVGHGRLDMRRMLEVLRPKVCPDGSGALHPVDRTG